MTKLPLCYLISALLFGICNESRAQFTTIINVPPQVAPTSIGSDTQLNLFASGSIGSGFDAAAADGSSSNVEMNISGGTVGNDVDAYSGSIVNIYGGSIGERFKARSGSTVNIIGGSVGVDFGASPGSTVNISGGSIGIDFDVSGSTVNISGGSIGDYSGAYNGSTANISGGSVGDYIIQNATANISGGSFRRFEVFDDSTVTISGEEFRLNGTLVTGLETLGSTVAFNLPNKSLLSGTLADGTPFAFSNFDGDVFDSGTVTLQAAALPAVGPAIIAVPTDSAPQGIRGGQTMVVTTGGSVADDFNAGLGSSVQISGGQVGSNFEAVGAQVTISGGSVGTAFDAFAGSTVTITGGSVGSYFNAFVGSIVTISGGTVGNSFYAGDGSMVNISGGVFGNEFRAKSGSTVTISGGSLGDGFDADDGSTVNISGGTVGGDFAAHSGATVNMTGGSFSYGFDAGYGSTVNVSGGSLGYGFEAFANSTVNISGGSEYGNFDANVGSTVNLFGTQFILAGNDITSSLATNTPLTISERDVILSGILADGSPFSFGLWETDYANSDFFSSYATLTITLVGPGDFNGDGQVNGRDFLAWQRGNSPNPLSAADLADWQANYGTQPLGAATAVPEPTASTLLLIAISFVGVRWQFSNR
jgi:hypothetical protein